jgi:hypothetical protein
MSSLGDRDQILKSHLHDLPQFSALHGSESSLFRIHSHIWTSYISVTFYSVVRHRFCKSVTFHVVKID